MTHTSRPVDDFRRARRQAALQSVMARLTGHSTELLSFDDVRDKLQLRSSSHRGLQEIPVAAIVGSVGRYNDFTRSFLPRRNSDQERWTRVEEAMVNLVNLPPIEVYQIGQAYFVLDGNHRVSVARQLGITHLEAYVVEFKTDVSLHPDDRLDELIIKAEYAEFLRSTRFNRIRPEADLRVTAPGRYWQLETYIEAHRYLLSQQTEQELSAETAIHSWYEQVYLPVIELIREQNILRDFPGRTETDLFLWLLKHRVNLEKQLGWRIQPEAVVADLVTEHKPGSKPMMTRVNRALMPEQLETGPPPGQWRQNRVTARPDERLFADILAPLSGETESWQALDLALLIAKHEGGRVMGLHVLASGGQKESEAVRALKADFERRCQAAGVPGNLVVETGHIVHQICERARWVDLIVMYPANPPGSNWTSRLNSGSRAIVYRSPRPVLMVPGPVNPRPKQILLAYNGSPKAQEALFVAAYLVDHLSVSLIVLNVPEGSSQTALLDEVKQYLEPRGITATYLVTPGDVAGIILATAAVYDCDLILMGGYSANPLREVVFGCTVDQILYQSPYPTLICR
jgi:nucleotide-binding universal stress UspA family protein